MSLVIAQQFTCTREALQGAARVGRHGDPCQRIKFADFGDLVDPKKQAELNRGLLAFIEDVKTKVQVKAAKAQKMSPKKPNPGQGSRMSAERVGKLLAFVPPPGQKSLASFFGPKPH